MTYEALERFKVKRKDGTIWEVVPGQRFEVRHPATVSRYLAEGKLKELRDDEIADTVMLDAIQRVHKIGRFAHTPAVMEIEAKIHDLYLELLKGQDKLNEYRQAVDAWVGEGTKVTT